MPLIKYNLHDSGGIIPYNKIKKILSNFNLKIDINFPFPFVYILGRSDGTISFCSSNIFPSSIQRAIYENKKLSSNLSGKFRLSKKYDRNHDAFMHLDIQLEKGKHPNKKFHEQVIKSIYNSLINNNEELKDDLLNLNKKGKKIIDAKLYKYDDYIYGKNIKVRYI